MVLKWRRQPERYFYRVAFLSMAIFGVTCAGVVADPTDVMIELMGISYYITVMIGVVGGLVAVYTP